MNSFVHHVPPLGCSASSSAQMEWNQVTKTLEGWPKEPIPPWEWFLESWQMQISRNSGFIKEVATKPINYIWNATQGFWGQERWDAHVQGKQGVLQQKRGRKGEKGLVIWKGHTAAKLSRFSQTWRATLFWFQWAWASYYLLCILPAGVRTDSSSPLGLLRRFSWDPAWKSVARCQPRVSCLY